MAQTMIMALRLGYQIEEDKGKGKELVSAVLKASSHPYKDDELGHFEPRILLGSDPEMSIRISHPQWSERSSSGFSEIRLVNVDGFYDELRDADFEGQLAEAAFGPGDLAWDDLPYRWRMRVERVDFADEDALIVRMAPFAALLDVPVQRERFPDTTPEESTREQLKPLVLGAPLQCPTVLLDGNNQRHFLAANAEGLRFIGEGGLETEEGTDPGEYTVIDETTIELNSQPTLMITADPIGPLDPAFPLPQMLLVEWDDVGTPFSGTVQRPAGWAWSNWSFPNRAFTRIDDGLGYVRISTTTGLIHFRPITAGNYRLQVRMQEASGLTNRARCQVTVGGSAVVPTTSMIAAQEVRTFEFTVVGSSEILAMQWSRDIDGVFVNAELRITDLSLTRLGEPATSIDALAHQVANVQAGYPASQMDWAALSDLSVSLGSLELAAYLRGDERASAVLDDLFGSCYAAWWSDPLGRLTCGRLTPPLGSPVLTVDDTTRTSQINVLQDLPEHLNRGQKWARNWSPIDEDRAADVLPSGIKARNAREYRTFSSTGGSLLAGLPQRYRNRLADDFRPSLIKAMGSANPRPHAAELENYQQPRRLWQAQALVDPITSDLNALQPLAVVEIRSNRFGIEEGILTRIVGIKLKPLSGYVELILWG